MSKPLTPYSLRYKILYTPFLFKPAAYRFLHKRERNHPSGWLFLFIYSIKYITKYTG